MIKTKSIWLEYCTKCKKKHLMMLQPCPECGVYYTAQPVSENVHKNVYFDHTCDGCKAYRDHLII